MPKKAVAKGPSCQEIVLAAAKLFVQRGYSKTSIDDVARAMGIEKKEITSHFDSKDEIAIRAFRLGHQSMEQATQRTSGAATIGDYLLQIFDGLVANTEPWGPTGYLNIMYQATKDKVLRGLAKQASQDVILTVKFSLNDMIDHDLITESVRIETVAEEFLAKFIEHLSQILKGKELQEVRKAWLKDASAILLKNAEGGQ